MDIRQLAYLAGQPSAVVKHHERFLGMPKRGLAFLLANVMFWQPIWARADGIVVNAPGTTLDRAGNGVPIVNIAAPNATGLSHNQFHDYNVGAEGVILNNATARTQLTQMGGIILGNPNLRGAAAQTILNEVNGGSPSQLRGYTEVAGQSARVIVANPYGISCNGCGFINTPRVTLTTGKPVLDNGRLDRFQVDQGSVSIDGTGLDASNVDSFEIITRSARINAQIHAKRLNITTGRNDVNADTLNATARADDGSAKPQLAIDSSALGGMYAGAIKLVGTEQGVGVKLAGDLAASAGDIQIDANGQLSMAKVTASSAIDIKSRGLDAQGPVYAGTQLAVQTAEQLVNRQSLVARDSVRLSSGGKLTNSGVIEAGVNADNTRNTTGDLTVNGAAVSNTGSLLASRSLSAAATGVLDNQNGIVQAKNVTVSAARLVNQGVNARIYGETRLALSAPAIVNLKGLIRFADGQAATLSVDSLDNRLGRIEIAGGSLKLNARDVQNADGKIVAGRLDIDARQVDNTRGLIGAGQSDAKVVARERLDNAQGKIQAKTTLAVSGGELLNHGGTLAADRILVTAARLDNSEKGVVSAENGAAELTLEQDLDNHDGKIQASGRLTVAAQSINNRNASLIGQTLEVNSRGTLDNTQGTLSSDDSVVTSEDLDNSQGLIQGNDRLNVTARDLQNSAGKLLGGVVDAQLANLTGNNDGTLSAQSGKLTLMVQQHLNNALGRLQASQGDVAIHAASLDNRGGVVAAQQLLVMAENGHVDNRGGRMISDGLDLHAASLDNSDNGLLAAGVDGARLILKRAAPGQSQLLNVKGRIQSDADLHIESDAVDNSAGVLLGQAIDVTATQLNNNDNGGIVGNGGDVALKISGVFSNVTGVVDAAEQRLLLDQLTELDNRGGTLRGKRLDITSISINNNAAGQIIAGSDGLKITGKTLLNQQGVIFANGSHAELALGSGTLQNQGGTLQADTLEITSADLDNSAVNGKAGLISSLLGDLKLTVTRLTNRAGKMFAKDQLVFVGDSLDNTGGEISGNRLALEAVSQILNQGGLIESATHLQLASGQLNNSAGGQIRALGGASSQIKLTGNLNNQSGVIEIGSQDLTLAGGQLNNLSGSVRHAAQGVFDLDLSNLTGTQGSLTGLGKGVWDVGSVNGVGTWQLNGGLTYTSAQDLNLNASDRIASASAMSLQVANLTNAGQLLSDGDLTLTLTGNLLNSGRVSAQKKLTISANDLIQQDGRLVSGGDTALTLRGTLDNLGRLIANQNLTVTAARINNKGTLGAQGNLEFTAANGIYNDADTLLFSGGTMKLHGNSLNNFYGDIYSRGNLSFDAVGGGRAALFSNLSGTVEGEGDIDINAVSVENAKAEFEMTSGQSSGSLSWVCAQHCGGHDGWKRGYITITTDFNDQVLKDSRAARFVAGKNFNIHANQVENRYSLLAANGDLTVTADSLLNQGAVSRSGHRVVQIGTPGHIDNSLWDQMEFMDIPAFNAATAAGNFDEARFEELVSRSSDSRFAQTSDVTTWNENGNNVYSAVLQAGGKVKLDVTNSIQNGTLYENTYGQLTGSLSSDQTSVVGGININLGKHSTDASTQAAKNVTRIERVDADGVKQISFVPVDFKGVPFAAVDPTASSTFRLPKGPYGMFVQSTNPQSRYLIETNPELTQTAAFMSSDYLLGKLNFSTDEAARRLGDGRYESRLISDAVMAQTGQRFLAGGLENDYEQFRYLMDNALASKNELNLSVGVSLTSAQVAALTHDIVWMEERIVDGQKVLVPVLYLAQAESRNVRGGSLIQGRDLELLAGNDLVNVGTLSASKDVSVDVKGSLYQGGLVEANERITLMATDSIRNALAGEIRGNQVSLTSLKGDIVNDRTAVAVRDGNGMRTLVDDGGNITARDSLTIKSGQDLVNSSSISSGGDASLSATRDINLLATRNENELHEVFNGGHRSVVTTTVENLASTVKSGGNLKLDAGRDINVVASTAEAKGNLNVDAKRDIYMSSAGDENNVETHSKDGKKRVHEEDNHTVQKAAEFIAGGDVKTSSGRDTTLVASKISAGNEAYVYAGNDLNLLAAQNKDYTLYDMKEKGGFGSLKLKRDEVTQVTHVGSEIKTGGNLSLVSKGDQLYQVAKLDSGKDIVLDSGGSITFEGVKDLHDESHTKTNNSAAWVSSKGRGNTDETLRQTQMIAKGNIVIKAVDGLKIDIKDVNQESVSQTIDAMVKADPQLAWLKDAEARGDVDWRRVKEVHESFKYSNSSLGQGAMLVIIIIITVLTAGAASAAVGSVAGATAGSGTAMAAAGTATASAVAGGAAVGSTVAAGLGNVMASAVLTSLASTAAVSTINNKGNLGAAVKETFSKDSLKNAAIAGVTTGFTQGVIDPQLGGHTVPFNNLTKGFDLNTLQGIGGFAVHAGAQGLAGGAIKTVIGGGSYSENLKDGLISQAGNVAAATAFNFVGGYAQDHWQAAHNAGDTTGMAMWAEGGVARTALHALMGGAISSATGGDFKTGAMAAGASQAMAGVLNSTFDTQPQLRQAFSQIVGLTAAGLAGGDVNKASWVALMADEYNRQLHQKETLALEKLQKENPDKAYEFKAAACALVHCSDSVPPDDPNYKFIKALEADGKGFKDAQSTLFATGAFDEYSKWDQVNDDLLRNDKDLRHSANASRAVLGAIGAAAGFGGAIASSPACVTAVGCAIPALSGLGGAASFADGWQATGQLFAPYDYTQGSKVLDSFSSATYPGDVNPLRDYGTEAAKTAMEIALLKGAGKYFEGTGASVLVSSGKKESGLTGNTSKVSDVELNATRDAEGFGLSAQRDFVPGMEHRAENINAGQVTDRDGLPRVDGEKTANDLLLKQQSGGIDPPYWGTQRPAWKEGTVVTDKVLDQPRTMTMVIDQRQYDAIKSSELKEQNPASFLGGWATDSPVNSMEDVRNKLAISTEFKTGNLYKVEFTVKPGVGVREGTAGDMWDAKQEKRLAGGAHQVNFMDKTPRTNPEFYNIDIDSLRLLK
ncbi:two-partner secretion domain-containing protein [Pseudomonas sp. EA_65y_Pfl2_P74]|uniref:two-partner secretion domain-containing protein n=1 Tax=Pseudomonas sp. EA_65y_Pfl2_P74 TaxID=3088694 RepID=UPI0030D9A772